MICTLGECLFREGNYTEQPELWRRVGSSSSRRRLCTLSAVTRSPFTDWWTVSEQPATARDWLEMSTICTTTVDSNDCGASLTYDCSSYGRAILYTFHILSRLIIWRDCFSINFLLRYVAQTYCQTFKFISQTTKPNHNLYALNSDLRRAFNPYLMALINWFFSWHCKFCILCFVW